MKNRIIKLTPEFLINALQGRITGMTTNLPDNIELIDIKHDLFSNQILVLIRSDSFEDVPSNQPPPEFKLLPSQVLKIQPKPASSQKTSATIDTQQSHSQGTSRIEDEFSPEQRKLLNFKLDGEQVIIKPNQFLKAEWEDINETVRSLGGRWAKGDIMSYWVVPVQ